MTKREQYEKLLADLQKYESLLKDNFVTDGWIATVKGRIEVEKMSEEFGIPVPSHHTSTRYIDLDYHHALMVWGDNHQITWPDDGRQPELGERLYKMSFSTGAYFFGDGYPTETFRTFFDELKTYEPKYVDTANKVLYFTADKAGAAYKAFPVLLEKYKEQAEAEVKQKKREKLQAELAKLEE